MSNGPFSDDAYTKQGECREPAFVGRRQATVAKGNRGLTTDTPAFSPVSKYKWARFLVASIENKKNTLFGGTIWKPQKTSLGISFRGTPSWKAFPVKPAKRELYVRPSGCGQNGDRSPKTLTWGAEGPNSGSTE